MQQDYEIVPFKQDDINHVKVRVNVDYDKDRKGPVVYVRAFGYTPEGTETFSIFGGVHGSLVLERGWPRKDKKKMELAAQEVSQQFATRSGPVIDLVVKLLTPVNSALWN